MEGPIIYVGSQGLFYDSIVTAMEPPRRGPFQQLYPCDFGLCTEFGPGGRAARSAENRGRPGQW